jgi:hypothetical protein
MFKTKLMTAAAVLTLTAGLAGMAHAQTSTNSLGTADQAAPPAGQTVDGTAPAADANTQADGSMSTAQTAPADTGISEVASSEPMAPVRSKAENNRMSRKAENKLTAELNQQQLQGLPSTSLAASGDTGLRTTDNSSVAAGSVASPTPSTATGDTVAPTDDSTLPPSQTETPNLPNSTVEALPDEGKPGSNSNPTDAADKPEVQ